MVCIRINDELCCTRAIVTAKARVDNHPNWRGFLRGLTIQNDRAILLHIEPNIEPTSCLNLLLHHPFMTTNYYLSTPREVIVSNLLDHRRKNSWFSCMTMITTTSSRHYRGSSGQVNSVHDASHLTRTKDDTPARTTHTIVLPLCKRVVPTIQKPNVLDIEPLPHAVPANVSSMVTRVFKTICVSPATVKQQMPRMPVCASSVVNASNVRNY